MKEEKRRCIQQSIEEIYDDILEIIIFMDAMIGIDCKMFTYLSIWFIFMCEITSLNNSL